MFLLMRLTNDNRSTIRKSMNEYFLQPTENHVNWYINDSPYDIILRNIYICEYIIVCNTKKLFHLIITIEAKTIIEMYDKLKFMEIFIIKNH